MNRHASATRLVTCQSDFSRVGICRPQRPPHGNLLPVPRPPDNEPFLTLAMWPVSRQ
jgi:hypothetical protein